MSGAVIGAISVLGSLWALLVGVIGAIGSLVASLIPGSALVVLGLLGAAAIALGLAAGAAVLNLAGVEDVYQALSRTTGAGNPDTQRVSVPDVADLDNDRFTDAAGRFSGGRFQRVTGLSPPEFIHLFVRAKGGRVWQTTLNTCLPWSEASVCRHLDSLEDDGALVRVKQGKQNLVCTPEQVPED